VGDLGIFFFFWVDVVGVLRVTAGWGDGEGVGMWVVAWVRMGRNVLLAWGVSKREEGVVRAFG